MKRILNVEQMQRADRGAMALGIPSLVLMERAALSVVEEIRRRDYDLSSVCIVCGTGNNAGDGVAIARILTESGVRPDVCLTGAPEKYSEQIAQQVKIAEQLPIRFVKELREDSYSLIIDAIFGIGLHRPIQGKPAEIISAINRSPAAVVAVDVPSGVSAETGAILGTAVQADLTVTFARGKTGLYLYPGAAAAGDVVVKEIGIPVPEDTEESFRLRMLEPEDLRILPKRDPSGNKGTFRKILVIAGSTEICGAAYLSAHAALASGAGMVKILTAEANRIPLSVLLPEALLATYREASEFPELMRQSLAWADTVVIGPGIGTGDLAEALLAEFLNQNTLPTVMDADALNLMARHPEDWNRISAKTVITPHMGEMSRLTGRSVSELKADPIGAAKAFAASHRLTCHLKDARSVTALPDGTCYLNVRGNSALATAGSGDVLTGILAVLLSQEEANGHPAAAMAAMLHALAGEAASGKKSEASVTARDLPNEIGQYLS